MSPLDAARLKKLLLLALSSDQPGEVMAAITKLRSTLAKDGRDVHWLADSLTPSGSRPAVAPSYRPAWAPTPSSAGLHWEVMLDRCEKHLDRLRPREREFIDSLRHQSGMKDYWVPTDRQYGWLSSIYAKVTQ